MSDNCYEKLRKFLNQFPIGAPKTEERIELKILQKLFTKEEAELTTLLSVLPKTAKQIARKSSYNDEEMEEKLETMANKGLIFRIRRGEKTFYNAAPIMIGLYEYSVKKIDKELASLFRKYYDQVLMDEIGASNVPGFKVLPINESLDMETITLPYQDLIKNVKKARKIAVTECICRKEARLLGEGCDHPIETCLSFGVAAEFYIENGLGREIDAEEAIQILKEADEAGLVHAGANTKHLSNICNCCSCCCVSMKGITQHGYNKIKYMNSLFRAIIEPEKCIQCEACLERCPVGAIEIDETSQVNQEKCLGCGLCAPCCPENAITLILRTDRQEAFDRVIDLGQAIIEGKKQLLNNQ
ncbi:MAG: 4Fe-4S dicluster domain-containing protein [Promethearchaeota archaeon]|nr:MAG: 4Fe-4S dicluster domain-containing protein [Candidatus Lokiarchaeota archaeon]